MRAAIYEGPYEIEVGERPDPVIEAPTDAVVRVVLGCVCGSDLWYYRGDSPHALGPIGHEFIGVVEESGARCAASRRATSSLPRSRSATAPARTAATGWPIDCAHGGSFGNHGVDGGQGEAVRVPFADATLVRGPRLRAFG